jgi:arylsulfatase A-like enzyme
MRARTPLYVVAVLSVLVASAAAWLWCRTEQVMMPAIRLVDAAGGSDQGRVARGSGLARGTIGDEHRYVLAMRAEGGIFTHQTAELTIEKGSYLELGLGATEVSTSPGTITFEVQACVASTCEAIFSERVDFSAATASAWLDRKVSLERFGGRQTTLIFHATPSRADLRPLWANPTVYEPARRQERERNVILISIDTLRADHLGSYGYARATSPFVDETFARDGTLFQHCVAAATTTTPSHMTMFTSVPPSVHGIGLRGLQGLPAWLVTMPELVRAGGYSTGAITEDGWVTYGQGFGRGFDSYAENKSPDLMAPLGQVDLTFRKAKEWLGRHRDERFFLFLHTYQVHFPYAPPPEYATLFGEQVTNDSPSVARDAANYDREIRFTDDHLRDLFATIRELGLDRHTVVILTSDHGEEFSEHGCIWHGAQLYDEVTHVPLMLWGAGIPKGKRVATPVAHVDLMPTILDVIGLPIPDQATGTSLVALLTGQPPAGDRHLFSEAWADGHCAERDPATMPYGPPGLLIQTGARKLARYRRHGAVEYELYDLDTDPGERHDGYAAAGSEIAVLKDTLDAYESDGRARAGALKKGAPTSAAPDTPVPLDDRQREKLRALGYVE